MEQHCAGGISSSCETIRLGAGKSLLLSRQDSTVATGSASIHPCTVQVMLGKNERLSRLDLRHNDLGDGGAATLAAAIKGKCVLQHLDLSANSIGHKGAEALAGALKVNTLLQVLDMRGNAVSPVGVQALEDSRSGSAVAVSTVCEYSRRTEKS